MIIVNGVVFDDAEGMSVSDFLDREGYNKKRIAVEMNGEILMKSSLCALYLKDGDTLEVVSFVGGG